jgi:tetratricopeptide (TPR) repeat protein
LCTAATTTGSASAVMVAAVHNGLGIVCKDLGRFDDAQSHYRRALATAQARPGRDDLRAALWHNLAGLAHAQGRYREAEPAARRAVELRECLRGPDHPEVARDLTVLAAILAGQGRLDQAEALYRRALDIFQRRLTPEHYEVAVVLNSLGGLAQDRHDPVEAEKLQRRALSIKIRVLGPDHAEVATVLNNLAVSLHRQGRADEAGRVHRRALSVFEKTVPDTYPAAVTCRANYQQIAGSRGEIRASATDRRAETTIFSGLILGGRPSCGDRSDSTSWRNTRLTTWQSASLYGVGGGPMISMPYRAAVAASAARSGGAGGADGRPGPVGGVPTSATKSSNPAGSTRIRIRAVGEVTTNAWG